MRAPLLGLAAPVPPLSATFGIFWERGILWSPSLAASVNNSLTKTVQPGWMDLLETPAPPAAPARTHFKMEMKR